MTMMPLSNKETFAPVSPIFGFIQELCQISDDQGKGIEVIQKGRGLFWPITETARNDMTQLGSLEVRDGKTITDVLSQATVRWCILSVSDSSRENSIFVDLLSFLAFLASATLWWTEPKLSKSILTALSDGFTDLLPKALRFCRDRTGRPTMVIETKRALGVVMGGMIGVGIKWEYFRMSVPEQDDATAMAYCLLFDQNQPFASKFEEELMIRSASALLASTELAQPSIIPHYNPIVDAYDPSQICSRIIELHDDPRFRKTPSPDSVLSHVFLLSSGLAMPWLESGVHVAVAKRAWYLRTLPTQPNPQARTHVSFADGARTAILAIAEMLARHKDAHGSDSAIEFMRDVLTQYGIISLCALALYFREGRSVRERIAIEKSVADLALVFRRHVTGTLAELEWMTALEAFADLRRLEGHAVRRALDGSLQTIDEPWRHFGKQIGLEVSETLSGPLSPAKGIGERGCDWTRCPLWKENVVHKMLRCVQCKSAQYCSLQCQRHDWNQGKHKIQCNERI